MFEENSMAVLSFLVMLEIEMPDALGKVYSQKVPPAAFFRSSTRFGSHDIGT